MPGVCKLEIYQLLSRTAFPVLSSPEMCLCGLIKKTLISNILKNIVSIKTTTISYDCHSSLACMCAEGLMPEQFSKSNFAKGQSNLIKVCNW